MFALLAFLVSAKVGWNAESVHVERRCSVAGILGGADFFSQTERLIQKAINGSEIIFMGWNFEVLTPLLGLPAPQDVSLDELNMTSWAEMKAEVVMQKLAKKFPTFKSSVLAAADRGATIHIQTWHTSILTDFLSGAKAIRNAFHHPNVHVFIDFGRGMHNQLCWSSHAKAVVFDRQVSIVSGIDFAAQRFDSFFHILPDVRRFSVNDYVGLAAWTDFGNAQSWQEWGVKFNGAAAEDVATVARLRQKTFCANKPSMLHRSECSEAAIIPILPPFLDINDYPYPYAIEDHLVNISGKAHKREGTCKVQVNGNFPLYGLAKRSLIIGDDFVRAVEEAEHYIYIESQYFVARGYKEASPPHGYSAENKYSQAVARRLIRAANECDTNFSVILVVPLAPVEAWYIYLTWKTCFDSEFGIQSVLRDALRKNRRCNVNVTEVVDQMFRVSWIGQVNRLPNSTRIFFPVFTHSKIIMTEKYWSSGSANFNDRSLMGRDNELNVAVQGQAAIRHLLYTYFRPYLGEDGYNMLVMAIKKKESIGKVFTELGRANNEYMKREMKLDVEKGFDIAEEHCKLVGGRKQCPRMYNVKQSDILAERANGRTWFTRTMDTAEEHASLSGFFFNYDPFIFDNVAELDSWWVHATKCLF